MPNCTEPINNERKKLSEHLRKESPHTATQLLECGVDVWSYRASSAETAEEIYRWLKSFRFIRDKGRKRDVKAS